MLISSNRKFGYSAATVSLADGFVLLYPAGTTKLPVGYNPATWMLEVTGGAMATLIPANASVDWPEHYLASSLALDNAQQAEMLVKQVCTLVTWAALQTSGLQYRDTTPNWLRNPRQLRLCLTCRSRVTCLCVYLLQGQAAAETAAAADGTGAMSVSAALHHASEGSYAQPFWRQLFECTNKALGSYWKSPSYNLLRLLMTAACALVYGTM